MLEEKIEIPRPKFETEKKLAIIPTEYALKVSEKSRIIYNDELMELENFPTLELTDISFKIIPSEKNIFTLPTGFISEYKIGLKLGEETEKHIYPLYAQSSIVPPEAYEYHVNLYVITEDQGFNHYYPINKINIY